MRVFRERQGVRGARLRLQTRACPASHAAGWTVGVTKRCACRIRTRALPGRRYCRQPPRRRASPTAAGRGRARGRRRGGFAEVDENAEDRGGVGDEGDDAHLGAIRPVSSGNASSIEASACADAIAAQPATIPTTAYREIGPDRSATGCGLRSRSPTVDSTRSRHSL